MQDRQLNERFRAYLPGVLIDWLAGEADVAYRALDGTLALVDISGFTTLTERLARAGKVGAEEISYVLDTVFTSMLDVAYAEGADLVKWCGDAVLLRFGGAGHPARACAAASRMRAVLRRMGKVRGTSASASLRLTAGVHSGQALLFLAGTRHRELVVAGPAASQVAELQRAAAPGEIVVSYATAALLEPGLARGAAGPGRLLHAAPTVRQRPSSRERADARLRGAAGLPLEGYLPVAIAAHLRGGQPEGEHRRAAVAFVRFSGTDAVLAEGGPGGLSAALQQMIGAAQEAAWVNDVTFLETDIWPGGGNIMLVAGAPRSHGRDEDRLLATVRTILDQPGNLVLRAGAHAGRVFAGDLGPPYRRTYSVKGDAVNLASRLTTRAVPGELLATADLLDRSLHTYNISPMPPFQVKGKTAPVHAFLVAGRRPNPPIPSTNDGQLVGREAEVAVLRDALDALHRGHGGIIELAGEPGIGKTRLLGELLTMAGKIRSVIVRCEPYDSATPYAAAGALLRDLLGQPSESIPEVVAVALAAAVDNHAPELARWLPLLATVIGAYAPPTPEVSELDAAFRRSRLEQAVTEFISGLLNSPAVIAVEDLQFADEASVSLLRRLLHEASEHAWLIVLTGPSRFRFSFPGDAGVLRLDLAPLSTDAAQALLLEVTEQAPLSPHQLAAISQRAAGNPMFLRELVAVRARRSEPELLPESIEGVIAAEIDQLAPADMSTLRAAAVAGASFDGGLLAGVLGQPVDAAAWHRLSAFVTPAADGTYRFRHALVRDTAYEGLPFALRRLLHGRLAEAMQLRAGDSAPAEAAALSLHFFHAQRYASAGYYAQIAGERAAAAYANPEAAEFFTRALESARRTPGSAAMEVAQLAEALGDIRYRLGEFPAAVRCFAEARARARDDPVAVARLCEKTALTVARTHGFSAALRWATRGHRTLAGATGLDVDRQHALLLAARALLRYQQGRYAESAAASSRVVAMAERCGARAVLARALFLLDAADLARGRYRGQRWAEQALAIWRDLGDLSSQAKALNQLGMRAYFEGCWDEALNLYREAVAAFERTGDQWNAATASSNVGEILSNQGRYAEAEQVIGPAERVLRASETLSETAFVTTILGRTVARSGQPERAIGLMEAARKSYLKAGERNEVAATEVGIAEALVLAGRPTEALAGTSELASSPLARPGQPNASALARVRGYALAQLGRLPEARATLVASLRAARDRGDCYDEALTADALIRLAQAAGQPPGPALLTRREELFRKLGVVAVAAPDLAPC